MAQGDIVELKLHQTYHGEDVLNVFHFLLQDASADAESVARAFNECNHPPIVAAQVDAVAHTLIEAVNLFDPLDFFSMTPSLTTGSEDATGLPPFMAASYRVQRQRTDMRHGYKRITGVPEALVEPTSWDAGSIHYADLRDAMLTLQSSQNTCVAQPSESQFCIVKRIAETQPDGSVIYRLPETQAELIYYLGTNITLMPPTTQNTRKR